jgi:hypothetical protein
MIVLFKLTTQYLIFQTKTTTVLLEDQADIPPIIEVTFRLNNVEGIGD